MTYRLLHLLHTSPMDEYGSFQFTFDLPASHQYVVFAHMDSTGKERPICSHGFTLDVNEWGANAVTFTGEGEPTEEAAEVYVSVLVSSDPILGEQYGGDVRDLHSPPETGGGGLGGGGLGG